MEKIGLQKRLVRSYIYSQLQSAFLHIKMVMFDT